MGALKHGTWMQRELSVISIQVKHFQGVPSPNYYFLSFRALIF